MRPITLTMQAFGPYAGRETIHFSTLGNRTMFVISGKTGSGKTTIFDAISYAIYGKASGEDRTGADLRSQFAKDDLITEVSLEFSLRDKRYIIIRTPQQERRKERGEGTRTLPATATLYRVDEQGRQQLLASKVTEVEERIKEIMLIDSNQFRQILMIPQGEFRKLLTSDSKDKEVILQRLFHTQIYKLVEEKLRTEAQDLKKKVEDRIAKRSDELKRIQASFNEELITLMEAGSVNDNLILPLLTDEIAEMGAEIEVLTERVSAKRGEQDKLKQNYFEAEAILKQFRDKEALEAKKQSLESRKDLFLEKEKQIVLARKAALLASQEELCHRLKKDVDGARATVLGLEENLKRLTELKVSREKEYEIEKSREQERQDLVEQANKLLNMKDDVHSFAEVQGNLSNMEGLLVRKKTRFAAIEGKLVEIEGEEKALLLKKAEIDKAKIAKVENERSLEKVENTIGLLEKLGGLKARFQQASTDLERKKAAFESAENGFLEARRHVEELEDQWLKGQASILAATLQPGDQCPVCGSNHHPAPAHGTGGDIPDEQALRVAKQKASRLEQEKAKAESAYLESKSAASRLAEDVEAAACELGKIAPEFIANGEEAFRSALVEEKKTLSMAKEQIAAILSQETNVAKYLNGMEETRVSLQKELDGLRVEIGDVSVRIAELKAQFNRMLTIVPEGLRSVPVYEKTLNDVKNRHELLVKQLEQAQKRLQEAVEKSGAEAARLDDARLYFTKKEKELAEERESFRSQMLARGFENYSTYETARLKEDEIARIDEEVKTYNEDMKVCAERLADLSGKLAGVQPPNLDALTESLTAIAAEIDTLQKRGSDLYLRKNQNEEILHRVESLNQEMKQLEERYRIVGDLSDIARGQNSYRLTFERYVLAAFLDDILREANGRLSKMTSGRFQLRRKTDRSKGNVQSGLELLVFDQYTSQERHVKTLSGGESFKAALSLALGLADVVQANAGGVSLETMFIDEGFGTLDPESLEQAIDALIDIQSSGRLVGIISHVPELKERIDARLEVVSTQTGSKTEFVVGL
ncbi:SbcC/MukB-like Walker B domain-containing protein [Neobacillus sp. SCS-31]|uniref:SbcC/MukB-like Walker B domain-containing protein n=1 Tax=Neobacillus oceani TaxID=3115292 RepID=UPI0039068BC9